MTYLNREQILNAKDSKTQEVDVPEWGGKVLVGTMSGRARDAYEKAIVSANGSLDRTNIRAKLCAACIVDEKGKLVFDEKDLDALGNKSAAALDRVFEVALKLNGFSDKDVEELAKN
jgi:hypothetical protein